MLNPVLNRFEHTKKLNLAGFNISNCFHHQYRLNLADISISETQVNGTMYILSFDIKEQLKMVLQNVNEINRQHTRIAAASSAHDLTRQSSLVTIADS